MVPQKNRGHNVSHGCSVLRYGKTRFIVLQRKGHSSALKQHWKKTPILTRLAPSLSSVLLRSLRKSSPRLSRCETRKMSPSICSVLRQEIHGGLQQRWESPDTS